MILQTDSDECPITGSDNRPEAMLLLGPTGSGKSPLGDALEAQGLHGRPCYHLDFGRELRRVGTSATLPGWPPGDIKIVRQMLQSGRLLEADTFYIARRLIEDFLHRTGRAQNPLVVLNGMPRHVGQAAAVSALLDVRLVVWLACTAETVHARIHRNSGGDRAGRVDDSPAEIRRKLTIFRDRTLPLIEYYKIQEVAIRKCVVTPETTASGLIEAWRNAKHPTLAGRR